MRFYATKNYEKYLKITLSNVIIKYLEVVFFIPESFNTNIWYLVSYYKIVIFHYANINSMLILYKKRF